MATFNEAERVQLGVILKINAITLGERLDFYATSISTEAKTKVLSLISEYEANSVNRDTTRIKAMEKNFGAEINPSELRAIVKAEIAELVFCKDLMRSGGRLVRG